MGVALAVGRLRERQGPARAVCRESGPWIDPRLAAGPPEVGAIRARVSLTRSPLFNQFP